MKPHGTDFLKYGKIFYRKAPDITFSGILADKKGQILSGKNWFCHFIHFYAKRLDNLYK